MSNIIISGRGSRLVGSLQKGLVLDVPVTSEWIQPNGVSDRSAYRNHLTTYGAPTITETGTVFNGSTDYFHKLEDNWRGTDSDGAVSAWIKFSSWTAVMGILSSSDEGGSSAFALFASYGRLRWTIDGYIGGFISGNINNNEWRHVVISKTGNVMTPYVDAVALTPVSTGYWINYRTLRDNIVIGGFVKSGGPINLFNGSIKKVKMWNRGLTQSDIIQLFDLSE